MTAKGLEMMGAAGVLSLEAATHGPMLRTLMHWTDRHSLLEANFNFKTLLIDVSTSTHYIKSSFKPKTAI